MPVQILVASPHPAFGELIRISLEDSSSYRVRLVQNAVDAANAASRSAFDLAILDSDLRDQPLAGLARTILAQRPETRLIVIPPNNDPNHPSLAGIPVQGFLKKPFYLPELLEMVEKIISTRPETPPPAAPPAAHPPAKRPSPTPAAAAQAAPQPTAPAVTMQPWLSDAAQAAQYLTRMLLDSNAHAALILQEGKIWAYAGHLEQSGAQEVAAVISRYWNSQQRGDLARFIRLDSNSTDYLLYATPMGETLALAMVFDIAMPLTRIRNQANQLARTLISTPPPQNAEPSAPAVQPKPASPKEPAVPAAPQAPESGENLTDAWEESSEPAEASWEPGDEVKLSSFLESVPPPDPDTTKQTPKPETGGLPEFVFPWEETMSTPVNPSAAPTIPLRVRDLNPSQPPQPSTPPLSIEATQVSKPVRSKSPFGVPESLSDLDPLQPGLARLTYTCVLVPRIPGHALNGELAEKLNQWVPQLCIAFGWRMSDCSVKSNYLMWTIDVIPSISPGSLVRTLRQKLSERMFATFPKLRGQNPSGDFWAPGYLIISGSIPPTPQLIQDFIRQTRQWQGVPSTT